MPEVQQAITGLLSAWGSVCAGRFLHLLWAKFLHWSALTPPCTHQHDRTDCACPAAGGRLQPVNHQHICLQLSHELHPCGAPWEQL